MNSEQQHGSGAGAGPNGPHHAPPPWPTLDWWQEALAANPWLDPSWMTEVSRAWVDPDQLKEATSAAKDAVQAQVDLTHRTLRLASAAVAGRLPVDEVGREYLGALAEHGGRYGHAVVTLGKTYAGAALAGSVTALSSIFEAAGGRRAPDATGTSSGDSARAAGTSGSPDEEPSAEEGESSVHAAATLTVSAAIGETARGTVTVTNRHPRARRITVEAGPLVDEEGVVAELEVALKPRRLTVPAGAEQSIEVSVPLTSAVQPLTPGAVLTGNLRISGGEEATVDLRVVVA